MLLLSDEATKLDTKMATALSPVAPAWKAVCKNGLHKGYVHSHRYVPFSYARTRRNSASLGYFRTSGLQFFGSSGSSTSTSDIDDLCICSFPLISASQQIYQRIQAPSQSRVELTHISARSTQFPLRPSSFTARGYGLVIPELPTMVRNHPRSSFSPASTTASCPPAS